VSEATFQGGTLVTALFDLVKQADGRIDLLFNNAGISTPASRSRT
jgi:NAD(P)-dependent dehydrogenase (short-subunit alcohol dehydrogenase family)